MTVNPIYRGCVALLLCGAVFSASAANLSFDMDTYAVSPGNPVSVTIKYDFTDDTAFGGGFNVVYDSTVLQLVSYTQAALTGAPGTPQSAASPIGAPGSPGSYLGAGLGTFDFFTGLNTAGDIGTFMFNVLGGGGDGGCGSTLCLTPVVMNPMVNLSGADITADVFANGIAAANVDGSSGGDTICDMPSYDSASEPGLYLYQTNCGANGGAPLEVYLTAVGGGMPFLPFPGTITADDTLTVTPINIEGNDLLLPIPGGYNFNLKVGGAGDDTLLVHIPDGASVCLDVEAAFAGVDKTPVGGRISIPDLGPCEEPPLPENMQCGAPVLDAPGFYAWQSNCAALPGTPASWQFIAYAGGEAFIPYTGELRSTEMLSAVGILLESNDTFNATANNVSWLLKVGGNGRDGFLAEVSETSETCLDAGTVKLGALGIEKTGPFSLVDLSPCTAPPTPCGPPASLAARGLYLYEVCGCPTGNPQWEGQVSGGNGPYARYQATIDASAFGPVIGLDLEQNDTFDSVIGDTQVDIDLRVKGPGIDRFTVVIPGGDGVFTPMQIPGGNLFVGASAARTSGSFDLTDTQCPTGVAAVDIEKATNGVDADDPNAGDAPQIMAGNLVSWTYVVTNTGDLPLTNVVVTDDQGVAVACPQAALGVGDSMICTGSGLADDLNSTGFTTVPGVCGGIANTPLYENMGQASGQSASGEFVSDTDPSHYCNPQG